MSLNKYNMLILSCLALILTITSTFAGTTGKISGIVKDSKTGEPLPGVNVLIENTYLGAATDLDGYYVILNVPPGKHNVKAIMVGYQEFTYLDVRVMIDQTTELNIEVSEETLELETIEVLAQRPVVEKDVASSRVNLSSEEIEALPIVNVSSVVGLQAGIQGLSIRGGGTDESAFIVNGITLRNERNNTPFTGISFTAVEEIQVQAGGFDAEFGNVRSGIINVVTKEGSRQNYSFSALARYRADSPKHFGHSPNSPDSYWIKPYVDPVVCWTGTKSGGWDESTQLQYPEFEGWNEISDKLLKDSDPNNDLTPQAAQQLFLWEHRRQLDIQEPDYSMDFSFGGPIPFISSGLGNLRFFTSYRQSRTMYLMPLSDDGYRDYSWQLKLTSDIGDGMKLMIDGLIGQETGTTSSRSGTPGIFSSTWLIGSAMSNGPKYIDARMFGTDYWAPTTVNYTSIGLKFNHAISSVSYYEASLHRFTSSYDTNPGRRRDHTPINLFGNRFLVDEAPFGFEPQSVTGIAGMRMGAGMSNSRDSTFIASYTAKFDFSSQITRYHHIKSGIEFVATDSRMNYARYDQFLPSGNQQTKWDRTPLRGAIYIQDKMEFEGMIARLGLRLDYSHAGGEWYVYEPYDPAFSGKYSDQIDVLLEKEPTKHIFYLSPRLAISFPITINSKLYFNYGHFRQMPTPENLYILRKYDLYGNINRIGSPNNPLPKTVAYELGYEHNLFDQLLLRTAGYYKDITDQPRTVRYVNLDGSVDYTVSEPNSYEDIRGFEITLNKNRGEWYRGFINYTYMVSTRGYYGYSAYNENPVEQRRHERETQEHYQVKPLPRPFARANLDFFSPVDYGPDLGSVHPLGNWRLNILANWQAGSYTTWTGGGAIPGIIYNLQWKDYCNVNLRIGKVFDIGIGKLELFVDIYNLLNTKRLTSYGFVDYQDRLAYYKSLQLPDNTEGVEQFPYVNIPGDDRLGDYRKTGVAFVPIFAVKNRSDISRPNTKYLYYDASTSEYLRYTEQGTWVNENPARVEQILDDRAYIDMPNLEYLTFLDPRSFFWGLKLSFEL